MVFRREEPGQMKAGALALLVHALFLGLMIFGVSWQNKEPAAVEVELWNSLPNVQPKPPQQRPTPKPVPKPEPKLEPKPKAVKPEPQPEAKPNKAEIELKAKEAKRKEEEQKKLHNEELKQQEKSRQEQEKLAETQRQQQAQLEAAKAQAAARSAAAQSMVGDFKSRIQAKIKSKIILPPDLAGNPAAEFDVTLMPTGEVLNLKLTRSSGSSAYDSAVERAIYKAQPLPLPPDPALFGEFRELHLKFRLHED